MRAIGQDGLNIVVSIPRIVIEREAERRTLTIEEVLEQFRAGAEFDSFDGVLYTFEKIVGKATGLEEVGSGKQQ
jgi:hypothetical protein